MHDNPYAPPTAALVDGELGTQSDDEELRRAHVRHERQLKAVGVLYLFGGALMALASIPLMFASADLDGGEEGWALGLAALYAGMGIGSLVVGVGFLRLRPWVRVPGAVLSTLGLLAVPIGTLINGWILYLMFCARGRTVLGPDYARVIAATPHVRYRRTLGDKIALGLLLLLLLGTIALVLSLR